MLDDKALAGRIAAIENAITYLVAVIGVNDETPRETVMTFYSETFRLALKRYEAAQPGPEKEAASKALDATHQLFHRANDFLFMK